MLKPPGTGQFLLFSHEHIFLNDPGVQGAVLGSMREGGACSLVKARTHMHINTSTIRVK